ncbi:hypothetical protein HGM15179_006630 [Zosterops borbonicus]|uniref:Uncharacterized protein n=1 Tax=Zosterops borbonicus TaxID=364589 RepID=A0A8K1GK89_9PASS|nr:hypothetical protein HGM15179_006630 [Zosterops borbonicus]
MGREREWTGNGPGMDRERSRERGLARRPHRGRREAAERWQHVPTSPEESKITHLTAGAELALPVGLCHLHCAMTSDRLELCGLENGYTDLLLVSSSALATGI